MKLVFITTTSATLKAFLLPYSEVLRKDGHVVDALANGVKFDDKLADHFDNILEFGFSRNIIFSFLFLPISAMKLRNILMNYDVIHCHTPIASFITRLSAATIKESKRPIIIYTVHGFHFHPYGNWLTNCVYYFLEKLAAKWTDYLITINEYDYRVARENKFKVKRAIVLIDGIGLDTEYYKPLDIEKPEIKAKRENLGIGEDEYIFLVIGEFNKNKNQKVILRAAKHIKNLPFKIIFAGNGKLFKKTKNLAYSSNLQHKCIFLGFCEDIRAILKISDCLILASIREGLPRSIMEAMSMEVPVIGSDIRGIRDLLKNSGGVLVPLNDELALANRMKWMINNKEEAKMMGKIGRKIILEKYDIKKVLPQYMKIYDEIMQNRGKVE